MVSLVLVLATQSVVALLPYPVNGTRFELANSSGLRCDCLRLSGSMAVRRLLTDDERVRLDDLMRRVDDGWGESDQRQRARMLVDYLQLGNPGRITFYQDAVLSCNDGMRVRALKVVTASGEEVTLLRDRETGEALLHVYATEGSPAEFVQLVLAVHGPPGAEKGRPASATDAETLKRVKELKKRFAKELETKLDSWDVNGQIYLPRPDRQPGETFAELTALWQNFSADAGRHVKAAWGILEAFDDGEIDCGKVGAPLAAGPALDPDYLLAARPPKLTCRPDASFWMRYRSFELPDNAPIETFFGKQGWEPLPPDLSFADAVKWLRSRR
jgi:hypothetical protein